MAFQNITLIGRTGQQPELRFTNTGIPVCNFSVAINEGWTAEDGQRHDRTTWACWRKQAETVAEYLQTGRQVMVSGKLAEPRPWTTESGELRANIEVTANIVQFLGSASDGNGGSADPMAAGAVQANMEEAYANGYKAALQELAAKAAQNAKKEAADAMAEMNVEATEADEMSSGVANEEASAKEATPKEPAPTKEEVYRPSAIAQSETPDAADAEVEDKPEDDEVEMAVENDDAEADDDENLTMVIDASNMLDQIQNTISVEATTEEEAEPEEEAKPEPATVSEDIPF